MKEKLFFKHLPENFQIPSDEIGLKMLKEYGAIFIAKNVTPPNVVVFKNEKEVEIFQNSVKKSSQKFGEIKIELQLAATNALKKAIDEAKLKNLSITPRNADSAKRSYLQTVENWASRVNPGLEFWFEKGKITQNEADKIKSLPPTAQIPEIFKLEEKGIFFAKGNQKSIIYSVAPPGTSQHIAMLALDVAEFENQTAREILARHGWFQTVPSDLPHFTFLGIAENKLINHGLKKITQNERAFWIPDL